MQEPLNFALVTHELFGRVYLRSSLKIVQHGFNRHWNKLSVVFLFSFSIQDTKDVSRTAAFKRPWPINTWVSSSHLGVRRGITDYVATWVSYGTSLIGLVCSWLSHDVAIWVHLSFHLRPLPFQTNLMINLAKTKPMIKNLNLQQRRLWCRWLAVVCDCGTPWTILLTFFFLLFAIVNDDIHVYFLDHGVPKYFT